MMPNIIPIPGLDIDDPKPIEDVELLDFMDTAKDGVIVSNNQKAT